MSTTARRLEVLRAIVIEHVKHHEPVSSKAIAQTYVTEVSSATIRNDMSALESAGLIRQPHTSAGRVPTETGYRVFVDQLRSSADQVARHQQAFAERLSEMGTVEDVIHGSVRALASITGQAAIVEYPDVVTDRLRRVELVDLPGNRILVIVVTANGRVLERSIAATDSPRHGQHTPWHHGTRERKLREDLDGVRDAINRAVDGTRVTEVAASLEQIRGEVAGQQQALFDTIAETLTDCLATFESIRIVTAGAANLARAGIDPLHVAEVLELLEDGQTLSALLRADDPDADDAPESTQVSIGAENRHHGLAHAALVSAVYAAPTPTRNHVGVIGPTRMDYARSLAAVEAVSGYLSRLLLKQSGGLLDLPEPHRRTGEEREVGEGRA